MEELKITTFGTFSISCNDIVISERDNRTKKIWKLIKILVANRGKKLTYEEISRAVGRREGVDSFLFVKTLLHRARNTLEYLGHAEGRNLILQDDGCYFWNTKIKQTVDEDIFCRCIKDAKEALDGKEKLRLSLDALKLYKGYYLDRAFEDIPSIADAIQNYHLLAIKTFEEAGDYMLSQSMQEQLCDLALRQIEIDPYQEVFHYYLIKACVDLGKHERALTYYNRVHELFEGKFKVGPSDRIRALHRYILSGGRLDFDSVNTVKKELLKPLSDNEKPLFCDYGTFGLICRSAYLNEKKIRARGRANLLLFTISPNSERQTPGESLIKRAAKDLKQILSVSLSKSDIYTSYSAAQFVALVCDGEPSSVSKLTDNIENAFHSLNGSASLRLLVTFTDLTDDL